MATFTGHIAVITGASGGIGAVLALALAAQGATLGLVGRRLEALQAVAAKARAADSAAHCYQADLHADQELHELVTRLRADFEHIDVLVHSASVTSLGRLEAAPVAELDWHYRINVRAPYALTQALLPMLKSCHGQIVFMNSRAGLSAGANESQYAATKHALRALADSLRAEVNADGVRVLSVFLGRTASPLQAAIHQHEGRVYRPERLIQPQDIAAVVLNALSLPRTAEITDLRIRPMQKLE